jgi:hypothetical protein
MIWSWGCVLTVAWFGGKLPQVGGVRFWIHHIGLIVAAVFLDLWMLSPIAILAVLLQ